MSTMRSCAPAMRSISSSWKFVVQGVEAGHAQQPGEPAQVRIGDEARAA
ncbi:hypothetical protein J2W96_005270 [Variovorax guangxiensis]|nr:hypothetical protein [Variovorax guangxiensis]